MTNFTPEVAITALNNILDELNKPENASKIEEARSNIGNEMLKMMQFIFPMVMEIEMNVLKKYGFPPGREGVVQFSQAIRQFERHDTEIARLHGLFRSYYLPPVAIATTAECPYEIPTDII